EIDSTQSFVEREHESFNQEKLTAVSADFQSKGRGTGGRSWHATKAQSVMVSFFFRFPSEQTNDFVNTNAPNVTKVLAVAAVDTLHWATDGAQNFGIKWPNDVVVEGCKIGGILARAVPFRGRLDGIIVGIGININTSRADLDAIARPVWPATSLLALSGREFDVAAIRRRLLGAFALELKRFFIDGFAGLRDRVNRLDVLLGSEVWFRVHESEEPFRCVFEGIQ
ncbi:birA, partial [Symbiodinium pilosum]